MLERLGMGRALRFIIVLVAGLAAVSGIASLLVHRTTRSWFEKDVDLRAELVITSARRALVAHWMPERGTELRALLSEITRDQRIMAAAACNADLTLLTHTADYPTTFSCEELGASLRTAVGSSAEVGAAWHDIVALPGGSVQVSAVAVRDDERTLGFVVLVHDLSFVERRDSRAQQFVWLAFAFLAVVTSTVTLLAARWSRQHWNDSLRRLLRGETDRPEFRPFVRDVRDLVDRIVAEKEADAERGTWTPERLKSTLNRYLHGEKVVIVANREPYIHDRTSAGEIVVRHPASGLVTALEPVMQACSGIWIAHGGGSADRDTVDKHDRVPVPPGAACYLLRRVWLTQDEENGYYYGFANEGLWPLCHIADTRPIFRSEDWKQYQLVNSKFADAVCDEVDGDDPIVLVQDYHFALAPQLIRERLPRATIIMFWHVPWPNAQRFGICPWRQELLEGMLGASILGFHTRFDRNNFVDTVDRFLEARIDREANAIVQHGRSTLVRPYPISVEWPDRWAQAAPPVAACRGSVQQELRLSADALIGVGVDRLDYTKGVEERLLAVERLLERFEEFSGRFTFIQLAAPSRTLLERYRLLNASVEALAERINRRFAVGDYRPVVMLRSHHEPPTVFRYLRAADLCYVSSLHDGMNLVAKEYIAARDDERGVLVLSQFTGAARELTEALIVNPYDLDEASTALAAALRMPEDEQRDRMRTMRAFLAEFNVYRWAGRMLVDAARLRSRDRLTGRLARSFDGSSESVA